MTVNNSSWRPLKSIIEVRFNAPLKDFAFRSKIQRILTGKPGDIVPNEAVNYRDASKKMTVVVQPLRVGISIEDSDYSIHIKTLKTVLNSLNDEMNFGNINRLGFRQISILEQPTRDYADLVVLFKKKFLSTNSKLVNDASDVALPLTFEIYKYPIGLNLGPMHKEELKEKGILEFEGTELPNDYLLSDLDVHTSTRSISHTFLKTFLSDANEVFNQVNSSIKSEWESEDE